MTSETTTINWNANCRTFLHKNDAISDYFDIFYNFWIWYLFLLLEKPKKAEHASETSKWTI